MDRMYDLSNIKETLDENAEKFKIDKDELNELVVSDLLELLGYDRRRKHNLERVRDSDISWVLKDTNNRKVLIVTRFLNETSKIEDAKYILDINKKNYDIDKVIAIAFTDGNYLKLFSTTLKIIADINIYDNSTDTKEVLEELVDFDRLEKAVQDTNTKNLISRLHKCIIEKNNYGLIELLKTEDINIIYNELIRMVKISNDNAAKTDENLVNTNEQTDTSTENSDSGYIEQIQSLHNKIAELDETIKEKDKIIDELNNKINNNKKSDKEENREMLDTVDYTDDMPKKYFGSIDKKIISSDSIGGFIGFALQELYSKVTFRLNEYIFNGDIFRIKETTDERHMTIGNKQYKVILDNTSEEEALMKLKTIFNDFPTVLFDYRIIGKDIDNVSDDSNTEENKEDTSEIGSTEDEVQDITDKVEDTDIENSEDEQLENSDESSNIEECEKEDEDDTTEDTDIKEQIDETEENETEEAETEDEIIDNTSIDSGNQLIEDDIEDKFDSSEINEVKHFTKVNLSDLKVLAIESLDILNKINYIQNEDSSNTRTFNNRLFEINGDTITDRVVQLLNVINIFKDDTKAKYSSIRTIDFNSFGLNISEDELEGFSRIPYTPYYISINELNNEVYRLIEQYAEIIGLNTNKIAIYINGEINDNYEIVSSDDEDILWPNTKENIDENFENENKTPIGCLINDTIRVMTPMDKLIKRRLSEIIIESIKAKIGNSTMVLASSNDIESAIAEVLAMTNDNVDDTINRINTHLGETFISFDKEDMNEDCIEAQINGNNIYIKNIGKNEIAYYLIELTYISCEERTGIVVAIDNNYLEKMKDYYNSDTNKMIATIQLYDYMNERITKRN